MGFSIVYYCCGKEQLLEMMKMMDKDNNIVNVFMVLSIFTPKIPPRTTIKYNV